MILELIILCVFVVCSAFFSMAETAFMSISRLKAETLAKQKVAQANILLKLKEQPRQVIIALLIGNNVVNIGASALATGVAIKLYGEQGIGIATGIMTFVLLTIGEIIPKSYATIHAEKIALVIATPTMIAIKAMYPLVILFEKITTTVLKMFGSTKKTEFFSESELRTLVELGVKENRIGATEKGFIEGVLQFKDVKVKRIMTPRKRIFSIDENTPLITALHEIKRREHTRIPVYRQTRENIVGIVYTKDILKAVAEQRTRIRIKVLMQKPLLVNEEMPIKKLFREMQVKHVHLAIVVGVFNEVKGLITLEDILEEIVGEIFDEKDISPTKIKKLDEKRIIVHGDTTIENINRFFKINLPKKEKQTTINEFLETIKKGVLEERSRIKYQELLFTVLELENQKPSKILIRKEIVNDTAKEGEQVLEF